MAPKPGSRATPRRSARLNPADPASNQPADLFAPALPLVVTARPTIVPPQPPPLHGIIERDEAGRPDDPGPNLYEAARQAVIREAERQEAIGQAAGGGLAHTVFEVWYNVMKLIGMWACVMILWNYLHSLYWGPKFTGDSSWTVSCPPAWTLTNPNTSQTSDGSHGAHLPWLGSQELSVLSMDLNCLMNMNLQPRIYDNVKLPPIWYPVLETTAQQVHSADLAGANFLEYLWSNYRALGQYLMESQHENADWNALSAVQNPLPNESVLTNTAYLIRERLVHYRQLSSSIPLVISQCRSLVDRTDVVQWELVWLNLSPMSCFWIAQCIFFRVGRALHLVGPVEPPSSPPLEWGYRSFLTLDCPEDQVEYLRQEIVTANSVLHNFTLVHEGHEQAWKGRISWWEEVLQRRELTGDAGPVHALLLLRELIEQVEAEAGIGAAEQWRYYLH